MSDTPVSLESLMSPSKTVTVDFPGYKGFTVDVTYLAREELIKLRKKCLTTKFNKKTHSPEEILDEEKFIVNYTDAVIKGWNGLKYRYLEEFLLVDVSQFDPDEELVYTPANAQTMMKNSNGFDTWVTETVGDLENFTGRK